MNCFEGENGVYMKHRVITGYPSIDIPQAKDSSYFERNPFIPGLDTITILKLLSKKFRQLQAIDCNELSATYQELIDDSHQLALAYAELGVKNGDIVTISLPSNYQAICSFLALNELGAVTTFIDTFSSRDDVVKYLNTYESPILINYNKTEAENEDIKKKSGVKYIITLGKGNTNTRMINNDYRTNSREDMIDFHTLGSIAEYKKHLFKLPNKGSDDSLILYTSGSTGQPKAVVLTNRNVLAAQLYAGNTSHTENITATKTMTCVPLRYPYGMVTSLLTSLLWGKTAIMTPDWDKDTVNYYYGKNPNIIFGSPAVLELSMRFLDEDKNLSQVSHFISGGDFLTLKLADRGYEFFKKHNNTNVEIGNGCGNAETVSIGSTPVGVPLKQSTAGKILVGSTALVIDRDLSDGRPLNEIEIVEKKYNEVGELCIAGAHVFKEYFGDPESTAKAKFVYKGKTYFRTGTLGYIDTDGYFTPTDRKSRFYIRSTGHKVYLDNVQKVVSTIDDRIADCAVVELPDNDELFINKAYIVLEKGVEPTEELKEEIMQKILSTDDDAPISRLKEYEKPRMIEFIDELPRNPGTEKVSYKVLKDKALADLEQEEAKTRVRK